MNDTNDIQKASRQQHQHRLRAKYHLKRTGCCVGVRIDVIELVHLNLDVRVERDVHEECHERCGACEEGCEGREQADSDVTRQTQ